MSPLVGFLIGLVVMALGITAATIAFCRWVTKNHLAMIAALNGRVPEWRAAIKGAETADKGTRVKEPEKKDVRV